MPEVRTIFLAADGRFTTLGRGDDVEMQDEAAEAIRTSGMQGWVAITTGDYHGNGLMQLARVHAIAPTRDDLWPEAVKRFNVARERIRWS